jgi:pimeloyl-ACP methyl ester carboxylesterase
MRKLWVAGVLSLGAVACEPETQPATGISDVVVAEFEPAAVPPLVPTPNDLALNPETGLVDAPVDPSASPAQQEFTRDYLNTLDGFPTTAVASTRIRGLDPSTVKATSVLLIDLHPEAGLPIIQPEPGYDAEKGLLTLTPPRSGWPKGGHYAVAVIGGADGLKGTEDRPLVGSPTWALLRAPTPLVECQEDVPRTPDTCRSVTNIIPSTEKDPAARMKDQAAKALRLEALRVRYAPVLELLEGRGIPRQDVALVWTFTVMSLPEVTFDPEHNVIPFPNDLLRSGDGTHLDMPVPPGASPQQKALIEELNKLDGFSTTAPAVSENSDTQGAIDLGRLDASRLASATRFLKLSATGAVPQPDVQVCLDCASSKKADGTQANNPSQLQFVPRLPLEERSTYAAVLTSSLTNERGKRVVAPSAFALLRLSAPLVDADGNSLVSGVSNAQAQQLEPGRVKLARLMEALVASGLARKDIALAWTFTTQSTVSGLKKLHALPSEIGALSPELLPDAPTALRNVNTVYFPVMDKRGLPRNHIEQILEGRLVVPFTLTGSNGVMETGRRRYERIPFLLILPATAAPPGGYPVTLFGHGLTGNHQHVLALANALAGSGRAVLAIDSVKHGDRSMCLGSAAVLREVLQNPAATDDWACADPVNQRCDNEPASPTFGRCIARPGKPRNTCAFSKPEADFTCFDAGQGRCMDVDPTGDQDRCEGGTFRTHGDPSKGELKEVEISGWNMLDLQNFFVMRDNFRHQVIDLAQVVRVLRGTGDSVLGAPKLDGGRVDYVGQSLGGLLGTLYGAVSPDAHHVVLNVPGGRLTQVLDEATDKNLVALRTRLYAALASQQMPQGSPAFDTYVRTAQWILDPADPVNHSWYVSNGPDVPAHRRALVQYITGDRVIPNSTTQALMDAANARAGTSRQLSVSRFDPSESELPGEARHGFLAGGNPTVTQQAQTDVVKFLNDVP